MAMIGLKRTVYVHLGYLVNGSMVRYDYAVGIGAGERAGGASAWCMVCGHTALARAN